MRLRYALVAVLLAAAVASALLALDLDRRLLTASVEAGAAPVSAALQAFGGPYLIVLVSLAVLNLSAALLLAAAFREERARALLRARSAPPAPRPSASPSAALDEDSAALAPGAAAAVERQAEPWGTLAPWLPEHARPFFELWSRMPETQGRGWTREWEEFEKFLAAREFDAEASAVALSSDGKLLGAVLALRQPAFEEEGHWWLESPGVVAALVVDAARRQQGIARELLQHVENVARKHHRPRLFAGGLESLPQLVPGVPEKDHAARMCFLAAGYQEVRRTCHMEAEFQGYQVPPELVQRETKLCAEGFSFRPGRAEDVEAFRQFADRVGLDRPQRRVEKFTQTPELFFFAWKEGRIAGFIQVMPKDAQGLSGIHSLFFAREHRGVGLGSVLLVKAHDLWKAQGASGAVIWTYPEAAARFYPRAGFRTVQEWVCYEKEVPHSWDDAAYVQRWR